jgi:pyridoxamine 5'-phosphate oxidase
VTGDALSAVLGSSWDILLKGALSRKSPAHSPVVATVGDDGFPEQRVMILREAACETRILRFHTDARSPKIGQIARAPHVSILAYHPEEAIQLRIQGIATTATLSDEAEAAWQSSTLFARRCYMSEFAPGTASTDSASGLPMWIAGKMPTEEQIEPARENFAILRVEVVSIDWLHLANNGHQRALLTFVDNSWRGKWIIP